MLLFWLLLAQVARAQLDTIHYFPPIFQGNGTANQGALYISTPSTTPLNFTITTGTGTLVASGTVSNSQYYRYQMNGVNTTILIPASNLNAALNDKGFIVTANGPVYANLRYEAVSNNQSFSVTGKGTKAKGLRFRIAHARADSVNSSNNEVCIMATENNTSVTIDLTGTGMILAGTAPPSTATPITVVLNKGQSYVFATNNATNGPNRNNMLGHLITANRPIVTVMGNYLGSFFSGNHDIGLDQPVSEDLLGTQFAFLQGLGSKDKEKVLIVANQNGTDVFVNGAGTPIASLNAGQFVEISGLNYNVDSVMFVQTSQPAYAWQVIFGTNSWANWGLNFVPPVSCLNERFVDFIPAIDSVGTQKFTGNLNIITYAGSSVLVNGSVPAALPRPVPGSTLEAYRIHGLTGSFSIYANSIAVVGFYGRNGPSSYAGYFSGFDSVPEIFASITDTVCPDTLFVDDRFDTYQWLYNNSLVSGAVDTFIEMSGQVGAFNVVVTKGSCVDTSGAYIIGCVLPLEGSDLDVRCGQDREMEARWSPWNESWDVGYELWGSKEGTHWSPRAYIPAARGQGEYHWRGHLAPDDRMVRLRVLAQDGTDRFSAAEWILCEGMGPMLQIFPNPNRGSFHLIWSGLDENGIFEIYTPEGRKVFAQYQQGAAGQLEFQHSLPKGHYWLIVSSQGKVLRRMISVVE